MKRRSVCGIEEVHIPECDDCSALDGRVEALEECCDEVKDIIADKQDTLVSGETIKTVNNNTLLGSGNVSVQETLVSGGNIKTVNNTSLLGSGNVAVQEQLVSGTNIKTVNNTSLLGNGDVAVQETLVSGTNIKTINNQSLLGSGNIDIQGGGGGGVSSVDTGVGLTGGPITSTGTIKAKLKDETLASQASVVTNAADREYAITPDSDGNLAVNVPHPEIDTISVTLLSAGWTNSTQSVTAAGVTSANSVIVTPAPASIGDYAGIYCTGQSTNSLTFRCDTTPSSNITVNVMIVDE